MVMTMNSKKKRGKKIEKNKSMRNEGICFEENSSIYHFFFIYLTLPEALKTILNKMKEEQSKLSDSARNGYLFYIIF